MIKNNGIRHFLVECWLNYRTKTAKKKGNLLDIKSELDFIKGKFPLFVPNWYWLEEDGYIYQADKLFNIQNPKNKFTKWLSGIFWDRQYGPKKSDERKKIDCNSINYLIACCLFNNNLENKKIFLMTWWSNPFVLVHTTIITKTKDNFWQDFDYGYLGEKYQDLNDCIIELSKKYKVKEVKCFALQDIELKVINRKLYNSL